MPKVATKKKSSKKPAAAAPANYIFAVGRRKTAVARVKLTPSGAGAFMINGRQLPDYFPTLKLSDTIMKPLLALGLEKKVDVTARLSGGGVAAQAAAMALAISRALVKNDAQSKSVLKKQGFLTRDARKKERKKPGLKRARRAPQWQKR